MHAHRHIQEVVRTSDLWSSDDSHSLNILARGQMLVQISLLV